MKEKIVLITFILISLFETSVVLGQKKKDLRNEVINIITENKNKLVVKIFQDSLLNLFINVYDNKGFIYGSASVMFSDIMKDSVIVKPYYLLNNSHKVYVVQTYDLGSTYGAQSLILIWYDGNYWRVTRDIFERAYLEDRNHDGMYEIVNYYNSQNRNGDIYFFNKGNFELLKK